MQGAEIEDEGSVLTYMTKSEIEEQRSSLLIMTQRLFFTCDDVTGTAGFQDNRMNPRKFQACHSFWIFMFYTHKNIGVTTIAVM